MRKFVVSAIAALMAAGPVLALAGPAEAGGRHRYYRHHHRGGGDDVAIAAIAGIAGLALGAALADSDGRRGSRYYSSGYRTGYRYDPYYDSYYGGYYPRGHRVCITRERVWDPYIGRHVRIERQYRC